jgi:hypothetical protein
MNRLESEIRMNFYMIKQDLCRDILIIIRIGIREEPRRGLIDSAIVV